jgi:hypothetical protein
MSMIANRIGRKKLLVTGVSRHNQGTLKISDAIASDIAQELKLF